jgi:TnpA family transposase
VLDEILDNETELPLFQHATATAGYTDIIFALFALLGDQGAPRLRDLGDQQ